MFATVHIWRSGDSLVDIGSLPLTCGKLGGKHLYPLSRLAAPPPPFDQSEQNYSVHLLDKVCTYHIDW